MKIYQISLHASAFDARDMTWSEAIESSGCKPRLGWKDPLLDRPLLIGEFGCAVSHLRVWEQIAASNKCGIILEEDAVFSSFDVDHVADLLKTHDTVWLGYRFNDLGYWYNCHAYAMTPQTAAYLVEGFKDQIIPCDEWVPHRLKDKKNYFFPAEQVRQIPRDIRQSTIEGTQKMETDIDFRIVTVATEPSKMWALEKSAEKYGVKVVNIGKNHPWRDPMTSLGGLPKIQLVNEYLASVPSDAIVMFMDGYDTFFADSPLLVLERFLGFGVDILFSAEKQHWPLLDDEYIMNKWPDTNTPYRFLNSGLYIGKAAALHDFIAQDAPVSARGDDQLYCQQRYLKTLPDPIIDKNYIFPWSVALDTEAYIFQSDDTGLEIVNGQILNPHTNCCPVIYHGNGGDDAKQRFLDMAGKFGFHEDVSSPYYMTLDYEEVAPEILVTDFLTDRQCDWLIAKSEAHGKWGQLEGDKFPAQEIRIRQLGLWDEYERLWNEKLGKVAMQHWKPYLHLGLRDAFTMRYSMETQKALGFHTDASLVTGSVKLNEDYEGAELIFPRQDFSNINVAKGKCILFPSDVTHGHYVPELKSGVKYSLTMWTSRYKGDING